MHRQRVSILTKITLATLSLIVLHGCGSSDTDSPVRDTPVSANRTSQNQKQVPVALIGDRRIGMQELAVLSNEAVGGQMLAELVLDHQITRQLQNTDRAITQADIDAERQLMLEQMSDDPDQAVRLLNALRERNGWGPRRFALLLRRNAGLRKLVAGQVEVNDAMVQLAYQRAYGPRVAVRMIVVDRLTQAQRLLDRIRGGADFEAMAQEFSMHPSAAQGGLLPPIALTDPAIPRSIRQAVNQLTPGQITASPVAVDDDYALLKYERNIAAEAVPLEQVRSELEQAVRLQAEATLMRQRARALLESASVTILDPLLKQRWQQQQDEVFIR